MSHPIQTDKPSRSRQLLKSYTVASTNPIGDSQTTSNSWELNKIAGRSCGTDRPIKDVEQPESFLLSKEMLFSCDGKPNTALLRTHFLRQGRLDVPAARELVAQATRLFVEEPNMLEINVPVVVCGDLHGQFFDMITLFDKTTDAEKYLFLGDYVDRGDYSCEVLFYLLALKISQPNHFFMLRGNHETRMMAEFMTFFLECIYKYESKELYSETTTLFDSLPLCAVVRGCNGKDFFCVHGGISPDVELLEDIEDIDRFQEPPGSGPLCDLIWADPVDDLENSSVCTTKQIKDWQKISFVENTKRQTSVAFGYKGLKDFLDRNKLAFVVRAHEVVDLGYKEHDFLSKEVLCITIFSAPNYCDMYENKGAVIVATKDGYSYRQYSFVPHPFYLPDFSDAFSYAVPFLMENLVLMLSEMVIDIKEEDPESLSAEEQKMNVEMETKARKMTQLMQKRERKNFISTKKRAKMLATNHPNMSLFERALAFDKQNEQAPKPTRRRPINQERGLTRQNSLKW